MLVTVLNALFGCPHEETTFPMTRPRAHRNAYVVCLQCGQEFDYDWLDMRRGKAVPAEAARTPLTFLPGLAKR